MIDDPDARFHWTQLDPESNTNPTVPRDIEEALEMALTLGIVALKESQAKDCIEMAAKMAATMALDGHADTVERIKEQAAYNARMLMLRHTEMFEDAWRDES